MANQPAITIPEVETSEFDSLTTKYLPYLREIQRKLFILLCTVLLSGIIGFAFYQKILTFIMNIFELKGITLVLTSPYQFFDLAINTGLATGVVVAFPLFLYYLVGFLKPALAKKEFQVIKNMLPFCLLLFIAGFAFGTWVMQFVISIYSETTASFDVSNIWDVGHFFAQTIIMGLCMGLVFQLPIILTILLKLKLIKKAFVIKNRKIVYAAILVMAAILPPNDVFSLCIITIVPLFLFELTLLLNKSI